MISINLISESSRTVRGHGVHSAYLEDLSALRTLGTLNVSSNSLRRVDVQHVHTVGPLARYGLLAGRRSVITAHLTVDSLTGSLRGGRWQYAFMRYVRACYNRADAVIAVSPHDAEELARMGVTRPVHVMANAVDVAAIRSRLPDRRTTRRRLGIGADEVVVVGVGQVQPRKDVRAFLDCARSIPNVQFYWVGGITFGPLGARYSEMRRLMLEAPSNARITGVVDRNEVFDYLAAADVFFLPSRYEGCPMAVLEAASVGLPILLRDLPTYKDLFGEAACYGDDTTYVDILRQYVASESLRAELSGRAADAVARFDSATKALRLVALYQELCDRRA